MDDAFQGLRFAKGDIASVKLIDCEFVRCDLSLANLTGASLQNVTSKDCKLWGLRFDTAIKFGLSLDFHGCSLIHASLYRTKIRKTVFEASQLVGTDFTECDITGAVFEDCDLTGATFDRTIIEKADFRSSRNYSIDPERNRISKAKFSSNQVVGLLDKYDIEVTGGD